MGISDFINQRRLIHTKIDQVNYENYNIITIHFIFSISIIVIFLIFIFILTLVVLYPSIYFTVIFVLLLASDHFLINFLAINFFQLCQVNRF